MFRTYDRGSDRLVAVKLFRFDIAPERVHQLAAELDSLIEADLAHPSIATPLSAGIAGVSAYLAEDFVAAESLDLVLRTGGAMPVDRALGLATTLAAALDAASQKRIHHGALHPRDVLLAPNQTKLTGLGVARAIERIGLSVPLRRPYTAPERAAGGAWDHRADVFSLAAVVYELLWGRRLVGAGARAAQAVTAIEGRDLPRLRRVFARALSEDPAQRFGTARAFVEALSGAVEGAAERPGPPPRSRAAPRGGVAREVAGKV